MREVVGDPTAEVLYWSTEGDRLFDEVGHPRPLDRETRPGRVWTWIPDRDGSPIALLTGARAARTGPVSAELVRLVSVMAEHARLTALLRTRVAQLTAARVAAELASSAAREQWHRTLHDGLQQTLAAARMDLDGLHDTLPGEAAGAVAGLESKMATALVQVTALDRDAAAPELDGGLGPALERAAGELGLSVAVTVPDSCLGLLTLPVYHLVRRSLVNVHKYAGAGSVRVRIGSDGRTVEVLVSDDGRGGATIDPAGRIAGIRRLVEELGGHLVLDSPPDLGTTLKASIPCVLPWSMTTSSGGAAWSRR
ncbi:MAG TPA: hypothetical protein VEZ42_02920 [Pseudonocardia sp.]|nr:hypothetical protein [Pseudonocardia sp.]